MPNKRQVMFVLDSSPLYGERSSSAEPKLVSNIRANLMAASAIRVNSAQGSGRTLDTGNSRRRESAQLEEPK
jgi:hypothetical protein